MAEEPRVDRDIRLEQLKLYFDAYKHLSTLSVAALVFMFVVADRGLDVSVGLGLFLFGGSLVLSLSNFSWCIFSVSVVSDEEMGSRALSSQSWFLAGSMLLFILGVFSVILFPVAYL